MNEEKEVKIRILNPKSLIAIKSKIEDFFSISLSNEITEKDIYLDYKNRFFFERNHGIRLRKGNSGEFFTYKALFNIPDREENPWFVLECEEKLPAESKKIIKILELASISIEKISKDKTIYYDDLFSILKENKIFPDIVISKKRLFGENDKYKIYVDSVKHLGIFIEVESKSEIKLSTIFDNIDLNYEEIRFGYPNLYVKEVLKEKVPNVKNFFLKNPDWNYLIGQKNIVRKMAGVYKKG